MATQVTEKIEGKQPVAFARGRQSLEHSVWYTGWLLTFLATGKTRKGSSHCRSRSDEKAMFRPHTSTIGKTKLSTC